MDYYHILGVARNADARAIKRAYYQLAKDLHPDRNRHDPFAQDLFKRINEAYRTLSSPEARERYDQRLLYKPQPQTTEASQPGPDVDDAVKTFASQLESSLKPLPFDWKALPQSHYLFLGLLTLFCLTQSFASFELSFLVWMYWFSYAALTSYWVNRLRVGDPAHDKSLWGSVVAVHLISLPLTFLFSFPLVALLSYLNLTFGK